MERRRLLRRVTGYRAALRREVLDVAMNLAQGKNIGEAALGALRGQLPGGPAA